MKLGVTLDILNQKDTPAFYADTLANRPAAGFTGRVFISTDTFAFYRDNGTGWDLIGGPGTGTITGSGTAGTIPLWSGASTIGNSDLRQLSSEALILNSATNDWPINNFSNDPGRFLITSSTNNPFLILWGKSAFGSGNELGSLALGNVSALSSTSFGGGLLNGGIENGTDGSGFFEIQTTNTAGIETLALKIDSTQKSTFYNDIILNSGSTTKRLILDADVNVARIFSIRTNNLPRWAYRVDGTESGSNTGSDFAIRRYNDAGTFVDAPLSINRATGQSTFSKKVVIENNTSDQQLQIVSSIAPSLRIDNLQTGATNRIGIGLATTTNNFIQGTTGGEMAIFNSSTTASPILFGIYDAGLTNTQEAARISAARNFLIGATTDIGKKLYVNGTAQINGELTLDGGLLSISGSGGNPPTSGVGLRFVSNRLLIYSGSDDITFQKNDNTGSNMLIKNTTGNILMGTTSDNGNKLQLVGSMSVSTTIFLNGTSGYNLTSSSDIILSNSKPLRSFTTFGAGWRLISLESDDNVQIAGNGGNIRMDGGGNLLLGTGTNGGSKLRIVGLPTSAVGLSSGDVWNNLGILNIVP
jgi:hypothetical protein